MQTDERRRASMRANDRDVRRTIESVVESTAALPDTVDPREAPRAFVEKCAGRQGALTNRAGDRT